MTPTSRPTRLIHRGFRLGHSLPVYVPAPRAMLSRCAPCVSADHVPAHASPSAAFRSHGCHRLRTFPGATSSVGHPRKTHPPSPAARACITPKGQRRRPRLGSHPSERLCEDGCGRHPPGHRAEITCRSHLRQPHSSRSQTGGDSGHGRVVPGPLGCNSAPGAALAPPHPRSGLRPHQPTFVLTDIDEPTPRRSSRTLHGRHLVAGAVRAQTAPRSLISLVEPRWHSSKDMSSIPRRATARPLSGERCARTVHTRPLRGP
jgi:hypothetical protein